MISYKLPKTDKNGNAPSCVTKVDGDFLTGIPFDTANTDYQAYLKWLEEGNTPLPADQPVSE